MITTDTSAYTAALFRALGLESAEGRAKSTQRNLQKFTERMAAPVPSIEEQERVRERLT